MQRICVFLGSNPGNSPEYRKTAQELGTELAHRGITTVYGGSNVGLMGALADAALAAGGEVIGVIPEALQKKEIAHTGLTEQHIVGSMHQRKALMAELSDGFIALPGGMGTLEELCEMLTWAQLGFHKKPCGLLDVGGYYQNLCAFLDNAVSQGFVQPAHRGMLLSAPEPDALLSLFENYRAPVVNKWIERPQTL
ncbi:hypothetical protein SAMN04488503_2897 [Humidesulfovibrio mexicanus]|uniref:Cytokinin riboside 5'-monophosphate phosphoribohydrolase n=1 Tax=Humidesulfovibrio mexicanus TaxID=147047 RepID=A0A239C1I0_9BACT|nr:TIGR00730 family Rossman fold protein [Humidesulfovibrio mexicanus]SNS13990.1 hypothetical protein SAMN04488503_2897 [Humidesulfovibrio mexicanus]